MRIVAALGGNALLRRGEPVDVERQRHNVVVAARTLAGIARDHELVVTHGNGPQVGYLALQSESLAGTLREPLDVLGAESEGLIGYLVEQELENVLPGRSCATLLTEVIVDLDDPAFAAPTKPIGPRFDTGVAERLSRQHGLRFVADGNARRRVVASPRPLAIVERRAIELLVDAGVVVVCAGGGGIPVVVDEARRLCGVEAVVDKDRTAALLARELRADALLFLTDAEGVYLNWGTPEAKLVRRAHPEALRHLSFDAGSMGPKVESAVDFTASATGFAVIGPLEQAGAMLRDEAGTTVSTALDGLELSSAP